MERREPDYEDEKLRFWAARKDENLPTTEDDPTVLSVDLAREEIFESRVYDVRQDAIAAVAAQVIVDHPEVPPEGILVTYMQSAHDSSFRILAKRDKGGQLLTWALVGVFAGRRELIARHDEEPEPIFREFVAEFEGDALEGGLVNPPAVVTVKEWRAYEQQQSQSP